jgi:hypothetical protein
MNFSEMDDVYSARTSQQDEEEHASSNAALNLEPPIIVWNVRVREKLYSKGIQPQIVVLATSRASCALINVAFSNKQVLASCILPEISMAGNHVQASLKDQTCVLYACGESGEVLLICCQYSVKPERSTAFVRALMQEIRPKQALILGVVPSDQLWAGEVDPSQEAALFLLSTETSRQATAMTGRCPDPPVPYLPSGSIVSGITAACLSYFQSRSLRADLVVAVDMVPGLAHLSVRPLAEAAHKLLSTSSIPSELLMGLVQPIVLKKAASYVERSYGSSLDGLHSIFS